MTKDEQREQRLAEALRANLRKRKQQQRGLAPEPPRDQAPPPKD